tara:strand:+ start:516 stop:761 length:246 start_codon:yes stop_codon:yes gene_type:complete
MEDDKILAGFIGKRVKIYPSDNEKKFGIVKEINEKGITFLITQVGSETQTPEDISEQDYEHYLVGSLHFASWQSGITFREA